MTARIVISCDGTFDNGRMPCRGAHPAPAGDHRYPVDAARLAAFDAGWTETAGGRDLCPAHARAEAERTVAHLAAQAPLLSREEAIAALAPVLPGWWPDADSGAAL